MEMTASEMNFEYLRTYVEKQQEKGRALLKALEVVREGECGQSSE